MSNVERAALIGAIAFLCLLVAGLAMFVQWLIRRALASRGKPE